MSSDQVLAADELPTKEAGAGQGAETIDDSTVEMTLLIPTQSFFPQSPPSADPESKSLPGHLELLIPIPLTEPVHELRQLIIQEPEGFWLGGFGLKPVVCEEIKTEVKEGGEPQESSWTEWKDLEEPTEDQSLPVDPKMWRLMPEGVLGDFADLSTVFAGDYEGKKRGLKVVRTSFTPLSMSLHLIRLRDTLYSSLPTSASSTYDPTSIAISAGASIYRSIRGPLPPVEEVAAPEEVPAEKVEAEAKSNGKGKKVKPKKPEAPISDPTPAPARPSEPHAFADFSLPDLNATSYLFNLTPATSPALASPCFRAFGLSPWSPPPHARRMRGDLIYLTITTLEGDTFTITGAVSGFWVSKSSSMTFDPTPRMPAPKGLKSSPYQSLYELGCALSPAFFKGLSGLLSTQMAPGADVFATFPISHAIPSYPWLVPSPVHSSDPFRTELAYLLTTATSGDQLPPARDWNEEFGQYKALPKLTQQQKILRDRLLSRTQSDFVSAAVRGAVSISRGDVPPLNPEEREAAHTFAHNGILFTRAEDAIGSYKHLGGNEASRVAAAKDLAGVEMIENIDVAGLDTMATTLVDYLGERWICQSLIPGLFKTKEQEEEQERLRQIVPEGADSEATAAERKKAVAEDRPFPNEETPNKDDYPPSNTFRIVYGSSNPEVPEDGIRSSKYFGSLAKQVAVKARFAEHAIKDKDGKESQLWTSSDLHGIVAPDGRSYFIDCFRMHCVDVEFLEKDVSGGVFSDAAIQNGVHAVPAYPHRLVLLRSELIESYYDFKLQAWIQEQVLAVRAKAESEEAAAEAKKSSIESELKDAAQDSISAAEAAQADEAPIQKKTSIINAADFKFFFNPDAFVERAPTSEGGAGVVMYDPEEESTKHVREASLFLRESAIPSFIVEVISSSTSVSDGMFLTQLLHSKGINMRYLGRLLHAVEKDGPTLAYEKIKVAERDYGLQALKIAIQHEMVVRAAKHILNALLRASSPYDHPSIIAYFFNLLLHTPADPTPVPDLVDLPIGVSSKRDWASLTIASLQGQIISTIEARFRYTLATSFFKTTLLPTKLVREVCMKVGVQLRLREYSFSNPTTSISNGHATTDDEKAVGDSTVNGAASKPKKKKKGPPKLPTVGSSSKPSQKTPFVPEDILNIMPICKITNLKSDVADEVYENGRRALQQTNVEAGQELVQEALQLYEQIFGCINPDSAHRYHNIGLLYHSLYVNIGQKVQYHDAAMEKVEEVPEAERADLLAKFVEAGIILDNVAAARQEAHGYLDLSARTIRQSVIISERTIGLDSQETIKQYTGLALLEQSLGNLEGALRLTRHALDLWVATAGRVHPGTLDLLSNAATMVTQAEGHRVALPLLEECSNLAKTLYGIDSVTYSRQQRNLAEVHYLTGDVAGSLPYYEESLRASIAGAGEQDAESIELKQLCTILRNQLEKLSTAQQQKGEQLRKKFPRLADKLEQKRSLTATAPVAEVAEIVKSEHGQKANLSVEELVRYIQGTPMPAGTGKSRKRKVSPPAAQ